MHDPVQAFRTAILAALGHAPEVIEPGRFHRFSTSGKRGDLAGWCRLFEDLRAGVYGCHRQGVDSVWSAADRATMTRSERAELAKRVLAAKAQAAAGRLRAWADNARRIAELRAELVPIVRGDPCARYLAARGFGALWPLPDVLRLHRSLPYWHEGKKLGTFPAMVAPIVAPDGRTVALHRTYLTRDGRKAEVPSPKKVTGAAGPLAGACIPLYRPARGWIGIAEGIETALAAWCASTLPVVAAYSAGALAAWQWPAGVHRIVIFADHDKAGREAADALRARALAARLRAEVLMPTEEGKDWCDVWEARGAVTIEGGAA